MAVITPQQKLRSRPQQHSLMEHEPAGRGGRGLPGDTLECHNTWWRRPVAPTWTKRHDTRFAAWHNSRGSASPHTLQLHARTAAHHSTSHGSNGTITFQKGGLAGAGALGWARRGQHLAGGSQLVRRSTRRCPVVASCTRPAGPGAVRGVWRPLPPQTLAASLAVQFHCGTAAATFPRCEEGAKARCIPLAVPLLVPPPPSHD